MWKNIRKIRKIATSSLPSKLIWLCTSKILVPQSPHHLEKFLWTEDKAPKLTQNLC